MRRVLTILTLAVAISALALPTSYAAEHHDGPGQRAAKHRHHGVVLVLDRRASRIFEVAPGVDPTPTYPAVTVSGRVLGCVPGELYVLDVRLFQRHREITGVAGGLGFAEFACGVDGTARVSQTRYDPAGLIRPGRLRVTYAVMTWEQSVVLVRGAARVRIPR